MADLTRFAHDSIRLAFLIAFALALIAATGDAVMENFSWPCYEGPGRQSGYDGTNLNICESLYAASSGVTAPFYTYNHSAQVVAGESCPTGSSSITGLAFYNEGTYPSSYNGALFFADYSRSCIWVMSQRSGAPDPATLATFIAGAAGPVDLQIGPGDLLFAISGSGNSPNVLRAVEWANQSGAPTVGLTGFDGGKLARLAPGYLLDVGTPEAYAQAQRDWHGPDSPLALPHPR